MNKKSQSGITLIALIITIIVLLILAGVTINTVIGENGILTQATKAKIQYDLAALKEEVESELAILQIDEINTGKKLTVSEKIDKLKEKNVLDNNMNFVQNKDYKLTYNGNIIDSSGTIAEVIILTDNILYEEAKKSNVTGSCIIKCVDGKIEKILDTSIKLIPDEAPSGYKFAYWIDKFENIYSYNENYCIYAQEFVMDNIFTAIYVKKETEIIPRVCVNIYPATISEDGKLSFLTTMEVPQNLNCTSITHGLLGTSNQLIANERDLVVDTTYSGVDLYIKKNADCYSTTKHDIYVWNKTNVGTSTWYARGYATFTYEDGTTETIYSPNIVSAHK